MAKQATKKQTAVASPKSLMARLQALQEEFAEEVRRRTLAATSQPQDGTKAPAGTKS